MTIKEIADDWFKRFYDKDMTVKDIYLAGFREGLRCENPYGRQTNTNHGCVLPKYKKNKWKKAIRHPDNKDINIIVSNLPNGHINVVITQNINKRDYHITPNKNLRERSEPIIFYKHEQEDKNGSKSN